MSPPHFPIGPDGLRGAWRSRPSTRASSSDAGFEVEAREIPHKGGRTFGYRVSDGRADLAYMPDHCPTRLGPGPDGWGEYHAGARWSWPTAADVLVHDAQLLRRGARRRGRVRPRRGRLRGRAGADGRRAPRWCCSTTAPTGPTTRLDALAAALRGARPPVVVARERRACSTCERAGAVRRRRRRRLGPQRPGRGAHPGARRPRRRGGRGRRHAGRWLPDRGADPARLPPRRLLGRPPAARRLAVLPPPTSRPRRAPAVAAGRLRPPARRRAARSPCRLGGGHGRRARRRRARPTGACSARWSSDGATIVPAVLAPLRSLAARTRSPWPASGCAGLRRRTRLARRFDTEEARALLAGACAPTRCCPSTRRSPPPSRCLLATLAHVGGLAGRRGRQRPARRRAAPASSRRRARRCETGRWVRRARTSCPGARAVLLDVTPRQLLDARRRPAAGALPPGAGAVPLRTRGLQGRLGARRARCPGRRRRAGGPATVHLGGTFEEVARERGGGRGRVATPSARTASSSRPASSTRPGRRRGSRRCGPTATCRGGSTVDMTERDRGPDRAVRPGLPRPRAGASARSRAAEAEHHNPNYVGGDINGGAATLRQTVAASDGALEPVPHAARRASTSARPRRRRAAACTACAAWAPRARSSPTFVDLAARSPG